MSDKVVGYIFHESHVNESEIRSITHGRNGVVRMVTVLQEANLPNRNGRIYPKAVIDKALQAPFVKEKLATNSLLGEDGHPVTDSVQRQVTIVQSNACCAIKRFYWDDQDPNILLGEVESAGTTVGKDWAGLIRENGMIPSFSMRGLGDVIKGANGSVTVKDPLRIVTYDAVNFPSHKKAYMRSLQEDATTAITMGNLARYAAANSKDLAQLNESVLCIAQDKLDFSLNEKGQLTVIDKTSGSARAVMLLEANLNREVNDALKGLLFGRR
jgi:hypothetical protein